MPAKTNIFTDDFTRANGVPGNNWTLASGGSWVISSNQLVSQNGNFNTDDIERPIGEAFVNGGCGAKLIMSSGTTNVLKLRHDPAANSGYWMWIQGTLSMTMGASGTPTAFAGSAAGTQFMSGAKTSVTTGTYIGETYAIKTGSGNKTTVVSKFWDSTGATIQDMYAATDTTAGRQTSQQVAIGPLGNGVTVDDFYSFTVPSPDGLTRNVIFEGDSITAGTQSAAKWYRPAQTLDFLGANYTGTNQGTSGHTVANVASTRATQIDANYDAGKNYNILSLLIGTNDLAAGASASDTYDAIKALCQDCKTANPSLVILLGTIIDRSEGGLVAGWSTAALALNQMFRDAVTNNETWVDDIIDYAADHRFTPGTGTSGSTTWYNGDKIHPNDAGAMQLAIIEFEKMYNYAPAAAPAGMIGSHCRPLRQLRNRALLRM